MKPQRQTAKMSQFADMISFLGFRVPTVVRRWKRTCAVCINLQIPHYYLPSFRTIYIQKKP